MTSRGAARRYAKALFDTSRAEQKDLDETWRNLRDFAALAIDHQTLGRVLTNPAIPAPRKRAVVENLIARAGLIQPPVAKLLLLLAERDRLALLADVARAFEERLMEHQQVVRAELITSTPLPEDRVQAVKDGLARATGRDVQLAAHVDQSIIGGAIARIGSTVYDGSVTRQLERLRERLSTVAE
jgi:F-type H+-transporting ATPase subunit delta